MARASGANSSLIAGFEAVYGAATALKYFLLPFVSAGIGGDQALIKSNLLGRGRNPQDPILDSVNDSGDCVVPVDVRNIWFWLKLLMGAPVTTQVAAIGNFTFSAQPAANSTITLNGTAWKFVAGAPGATEVQIGANLAATIVALATALNGSADVQTAKATYTAAATQLLIAFDTVGIVGNAWTLAASATSNAAPSGANLTRGGYKHVFTSAAATLPSGVVELGFPEVPSYGRNQGIGNNTMKISLASTGLLDATMSLVGQREITFAASIAGGAATQLDTIRFGQLTGSITRNGAQLASITSGDFTYNNNFDLVRTIRPDGAIDGWDPGLVDVGGTITSRFADTVLLDQAQSQLPCDIAYGWSTPSGYALDIDTPRVFLPRPKRSVSGPQGVEVQFAWQAALDSVTGKTCSISLINDMAAADYA